MVTCHRNFFKSKECDNKIEMIYYSQRIKDKEGQKERIGERQGGLQSKNTERKNPNFTVSKMSVVGQ